MALRYLSPIHKATRQIEIYLANHLSDWGVSLKEAHLLTYLKSYGPCPVGQLHLIFGLKHSTLTSMLDRLEKRKLLTRSPRAGDRRSFLVAVTATGRRLATRVDRNLTDLESEIESSLTAADHKGFARVMAAIGQTTQVEFRKKRSR